MANTVLVKRSTVAGRVPSTAQLAAGELAVNVTDGKLFLKRVSGAETVIELGQTGPQGPTGPAGPQGATGPTGPKGILARHVQRVRRAQQVPRVQHRHINGLVRAFGFILAQPGALTPISRGQLVPRGQPVQLGLRATPAQLDRKVQQVRPGQQAQKVMQARQVLRVRRAPQDRHQRINGPAPVCVFSMGPPGAPM